MATAGGMRARWAAIGAAVAVSLGGGGLAIVRATTSEGVRSVYVPITPCRLFDTRPSPYLVGARTTPIGPAEAVTFQVTGAVGQCTIPSDATGVSMNLTVVAPTQNGFVTVYPADAARPPTASVNFLAGEVRQNSLQTKLSPTGAIAIHNYAGASDVIADVTGYYVDHDHDDRYYTKAQIDAMHAPVMRTISVTAEGLNLYPGTSVITHSAGGGLAWGNSFNATATWTLARPPDATGSGTITLTVWFTRSNSLSGDVSFSARPKDWDADGATSDEPAALGTTQSTAGSNVLRSVTIQWPASGEASAFWDIAVQRNSSIPNVYTASVTVLGLSLTYEATR